MLAALYFLPILQTGLTDADAYLQYMSSVMSFDGISPSDAYGKLVAHYRTLQPGFFPLAQLPLALWLVDPPRSFVKALQLILVAGTFATFSVVARYLFQSRICSLVAVVVALAAWELRTPHDPTIGTSFVTPLIAQCILLAYAGWLIFRSSGRRIWLSVCCVAIVAGMLSDPLGWGFGAMLAVHALFDRRHSRARFAPLVSFLLGIAVSIPFGLPRLPWARHGDYGGDVLVQMLAPLPASYRAFGHLPIGRVPAFWHGAEFVDDRFIGIPAIHLFGWLLVVTCTAIAFATLRSVSPTAKANSMRRALIFGIAFWSIPALVLGPPGTWLRGLPPGQAFDGVFLQYFGVGTIATVGLIRLRTVAGGVAQLSPSLFALTVLWLIYGNVRADANTVAKSVRSAVSRDLIERAGSAGFFDVLPAGSTVAVSPTEPFADGIHANVADAKYAIYAFSKRRFRVVDARKLDGRSMSNIWILRTSRTSGIFVSLDRWAGRGGRNVLTDRSYGYSVFPTVRAALALPQRSLEVNLTSLQDGFAIAARRTCGPVPLDLAFAASTPSLTFASGFYNRGVYGFYSPATNLGQPAYPIYMEPKASLVIRPTTCAASPLLLNVTVSSVGPSTLVAIFPRRQQRVYMPAGVQSFVLNTPSIRSPIALLLTTDAPAISIPPPPFRYERDRPRDVRLTFSTLSVSEMPFVLPQRWKR